MKRCLWCGKREKIKNKLGLCKECKAEYNLMKKLKIF